MSPLKTAALAILALLFAASGAEAAGQYCALAGQKPVLAARLFFGQNIAGRQPVTAAEWDDFLARTVTPNFPSGFTVYDGHGQWQGAGTSAITRENTKVIEIEAEDSPALHRKLEDVASAYRSQFHQQSVGIVTTEVCARF